jgi:hypothetical protein
MGRAICMSNWRDGEYSSFWDRKRGYGLAKLKGDSNVPEVETLAPCHSRALDRARPIIGRGEPYYDGFHNERLGDLTYHADGQILDEVYEYWLVHAEQDVPQRDQSARIATTRIRCGCGIPTTSSARRAMPTRLEIPRWAAAPSSPTRHGRRPVRQFSPHAGDDVHGG